MTPVIEQPIITQNPIAKTSFLKGFFNFDTFITTQIVKVIYAVEILLILLAQNQRKSAKNAKPKRITLDVCA